MMASKSPTCRGCRTRDGRHKRALQRVEHWVENYKVAQDQNRVLAEELAASQAEFGQAMQREQELRRGIRELEAQLDVATHRYEVAEGKVSDMRIVERQVERLIMIAHRLALLRGDG